MRFWKPTLRSWALAPVILLGAITLAAATPYKKAPPAPVAANPPPASAASIAAGQKTYRGLDCSDCHVLNKLGKPGGGGPDLTHIGATWTQARLRTLIRHPAKVNPKGWMPAYGKDKIVTAQMSTLVAYLASLK